MKVASNEILCDRFALKRYRWPFQSENLQKQSLEECKDPKRCFSWSFSEIIVSDKHRKVKEEAEQTFEKFSNRIDSSQDWNKIPQSVHFMIIIQTFESISRPQGRIVGLLKSRDFDQQVQAVDCL